MTTFGDRVYELGGAPMSAAGVSLNGTWYYVDADNGSASNDGRTPQTAVAKISTALAKCTTGKNDVVCVLAATAGVTETAAVDWSLNRTHLIGVGAPTMFGKRTRIISGANALSPFITVSGAGCIFKNLRIVHEQTGNAASLVAVKVSGERNYFENVEFCGNVAAAQAIDGGASLQISAGGAENLFKNCTFGMDTNSWATGLMAVVVDADANVARNYFQDCWFHAYAASTSAGFVELLAGTPVDRSMTFERCKFINFGTSTMATVFVTSMDGNNHKVILIDCWKSGATDWEHGNAGGVWMNMPVPTGVQGATNSGQLIVTSG